MRRPSRTLALIVPLLALAVAGCGSSSKPAPDPATIVPASAPLYVSAIVRPQGSLKTNTLADARTLTHESEPFAALLGALVVSPPSGAAYIGRGSVESWLGERAGLFLTRVEVPALNGPVAALTLLEHALTGQLLPGSHAAGRSEGALILDVTNAAKAREFFRSAGAPGSPAHNVTYRGVTLTVSSTGRAFALVGKFAVVGGERALKEVIDTSAGGSALAKASAYTTLRDSADSEGALANAYASAPALLHSLQAAPGTASQALSLLKALAPSGALYLTLAPQSHEVRLDLDSSPAGAAPVPSAAESEQEAIAQQSFQALPENSSFALRVVNFGAFAEHALTLLASPGGSGLTSTLLGSLRGSSGSLLSSLGPSLERLLAALEQRRSVVDRELLSWMGPAAIFVSGSSLAELNAGVVITPKSTAQARAALGRLPQLLAGTGATVGPLSVPGAEVAATVNVAGLPVPLQVGLGEGKVVIGLGLAPISAALAPSGTLGGSAAYQNAVKSLGEGIQPALIVNPPALLGLASVLGIGNGGALGELLPYLRSFTSVTAGSKQLGSITRTRFLIGVG